jgi:hypothetical protein
MAGCADSVLLGQLLELRYCGPHAKCAQPYLPVVVLAVEKVGA